MDLRQLRYFAVLAEEKHFGRAAKRLCVSQPPLSLAIRQLEAELGVTLFQRTSRHVALTPAGRALWRETDAILHRLNDTRTLVRQVSAGKLGRLRVGFAGAMLFRGLSEILAEFRAANPDIVVILNEMNSADQLRALDQDEIDVGFVHSRGPPTGLEGFLYRSEPFVACVPLDRAHSHLARKKRLRLSELANEEFVLFSRSASPEYHASIVSLCVAAGFLPHVTHEVGHWLGIVSLVAHRIGVALVPHCLENSGIAGAAFVPLERSPISSESWCVWREGSGSGELLSAFADMVSRFRDPQVEAGIGS